MAQEPTSEADVWLERGLISSQSGDLISAEACYRSAIQLNPGHVNAINNLGNVLKARGDPNAAAELYNQAIRLAPGFAVPYNNLGTLYFDAGRWMEAASCFEKALELQPEYPAAAAQLLASKQQLCDWRALDSLSEKVLQYVRSGALIPPMNLLGLPSAGLAELQLCARTWARARLEPIARVNPRPAYAPRHSQKLRVGYLSSDFRAHAVAYLTAELFELHDRNGFEIVAYSYGPDDQSAMRRRLVEAFDDFQDVQRLHDSAVAKTIHADAIDILVDLTGFTGSARSGILAYRPAPIQVQFVGYPGTMGSKLIDYLIADSFLVPPASEPYYDEKIVRLPHCFQPNDRNRAIGPTPSRTHAGLPSTGFVFCSFNQTFKITPPIFAVWMQLLKSVSGSVLWMLESNPWALNNLRREAQKLGVDGGRLITAPKLPMPDHLGRLKLADLMLDTAPYNAHTTASDALWTGVPIITLPGETFASRGAGSLLQTMGLCELIADDIHDYEQRALDLARNPSKSAAVKSKVLRQRDTSPLFDSEHFVRDLESIYISMMAASRAH